MLCFEFWSILILDFGLGMVKLCYYLDGKCVLGRIPGQAVLIYMLGDGSRLEGADC
jgi:hypothetical protein